MKKIFILLFLFVFLSTTPAAAIDIKNFVKNNDVYVAEQLKYTLILLDAKDHPKRFRKDTIDLIKKIPLRSLPNYPGFVIVDRDKAMAIATIQALLRMRLMLDSFDSDKFCRQIGAHLIADINDVKEKRVFPAETGGLVLIHNSRAVILPIPDEARLSFRNYRDRQGNSVSIFINGTNGIYDMPDWADQIRHALKFHQHATSEDDTKHARPSCSMGGTANDVGNAVYEINRYGETHQLVITKLKGRNFSAIYYGGGRDQNGNIYIIIVNLGDRSY